MKEVIEGVEIELPEPGDPVNVEILPPDAPDALRAMAMVAGGQRPDTAYGYSFQAFLDDKPGKFAEDLTRLWTAYWAGRSGVGKVDWDGKGVCPLCKRESSVVDGGSDKAVEAIERFLKEERQ